MDGIIGTLRESSLSIRPIVEYLDCKRFPSMEHFDRIRDLFAQKYHGRKFAVVIAADNPALLFALKYRPQLFPGASIVFCGINGFRRDMIDGYEKVTGVAELLDAGGTVNASLRLHPHTRQIEVVHDYSITGLSTRRETEEQLKAVSGAVRIRYMENMTTTELMRNLRTLPSDSLVLALSYSHDKEGHVINHEKIARIIGEDIRFELRVKSVKNILADQGQIEQVLMDLIANACDAMPDGGRLLIETGKELLDRRYAEAHEG
ncbi:MAG: hypothetical protein ACM3MB_04740 [Acidobacteriota bacterium]